MGIYLTGVSNETILSEEDISSYSYSEEVNSIEPSQIRGGSGQVNVSSRAGHFTVQNALDFVDTELTLTDSDLGTVPFKVTNITKDMSGMVSITGETLSDRLNVEVTAIPVSGTLKSAIDAYCALASVVPQYDTNISNYMTSRSVAFIGWKGNLWEHLKMLCAGVSASTSSHIPFEMYVSNGVLRFRRALVDTISLSEYETDRSIKIDSGNLADGIEMYNYNTSYKTNGLVQEQDRGNSGSGDQTDPSNPLKLHPASTDVISVNAGETVEKIIKVNATLTSIAEPQAIDASVDTYPPDDPWSRSRYTVYGSNNEPLPAATWVGLGGTVKLSLTEEPDEVKIVVKAPPKPVAETTPPNEGGESGTGNSGVVSLANPIATGTWGGIVGSTDTVTVTWTAVSGAEYYVLTADPSSGATASYTFTEVPTSGFTRSYSSSLSWSITVKAVTNSAIVGGVPNSFEESSPSAAITLANFAGVDRVSGGGGTSTGGSTVAGALPDNTVSQPDIPGTPVDSSDPNTAPTTLAYESYKIGYKRALEVEYPSFWIMGTGVFFDKVLKKPEDTPSLSTGNTTQNKVGATIDNPFITTDADFGFKSALAVNAYKYPEVTMDQGVAINGSFGNLIGKQQVVDGATFRIENVSYSQGDINVSSRKV